MATQTGSLDLRAVKQAYIKTVAKAQAIYKRTNSNSAPSAPTSKITANTDQGTTGNWTLCHMSRIYASNLAYKYLWTCNQFIAPDGTFLGCSDVVPDEGTVSINGADIVAGTVTADQMAANSITAGKIASNAVTADKLDATTINASNKLTVGAFTEETQTLIPWTSDTENEPYLFRASGGSIDHDFAAEYDKIVGGSVAWNQLVANSGSSLSVTVPNGHKYLLKKGTARSIASSTGSAVTELTGGTDNIFDLTQMFGSTIADYIYSLEQSTAGAGVAWFRKLFPSDYYAYDAGTLKSVEGLSAHKTTGFNQWDEEWEQGGINASNGTNTLKTTRTRSKNYIPVISGASYYFNIGANGISNGLLVCFYDADKNYISGGWQANALITIPSNAYHIRFCTGDAYGGTYLNDICINLAWDNSRNGEYEPYELHSYPLDSDLTLRGIPKLDANNNLYYDGDTYESTGVVTRKYGVRAYQSGDATSDTMITDGTNTVYKLSTPTTETATPYTNPQAVSNLGTEEYVSTSIVPVGHETQYANAAQAGSGVIAGEQANVASKIATNYITAIDESGIKIHAEDNVGTNYAQIDATGMDIYKGGDSVAKYGDSARVGKLATRHIEIGDGGLQVYQDANTVMAHLGYGSGNSESGTAIAPYFVFGTPKSGVTLGNYSVSEGADVAAGGYCSHAEGNGSTTSGSFSHAEGLRAKANASYSHAEGFETTAASNGSHAEGYNTQANAMYAHAEGASTIASGIHSHAEGTSTTASGYSSHAGGMYTVAASDYQTAIGKYNANDASNAFEIGWGTSSSARKNVFSVGTDGTVKINGSLALDEYVKTTITPTGCSNYSSYGGSYYEKCGRVVHVHVGVSGLTANTSKNIFTLPEGYRPTSRVFGHGTGGAWNNLGYVDIGTDGVITVRSEGTYCGADATFLV